MTSGHRRLEVDAPKISDAFAHHKSRRRLLRPAMFVQIDADLVLLRGLF